MLTCIFKTKLLIYKIIVVKIICKFTEAFIYFILDHSNTTITLTENHQRVAPNPNQLFAETNVHKISPISIQVHRKSVSTNNNHILSPAGSGKFSNDCFESPATSPAHSPRRSPYSSPSTSPMSHRKDYSNSKHVDAYSSASNWLKSLRLHKYSVKFEGYTFQMVRIFIFMFILKSSCIYTFMSLCRPFVWPFLSWSRPISLEPLHLKSH